MIYFYLIILMGIAGFFLLILAFIFRMKKPVKWTLIIVGCILLYPTGNLVKERLEYKIESYNNLGPLIQAIQKQQYDKMKQLIDAGYNVNEEINSYPSTALLHAIHQKDLEAVKLLVENGADVNIHVKNGGIPLDNAIYSGDERIIIYLLENGADVSLATGTNPPSQPIQYAMRVDASKEVIAILLKYGADINAALPGDLTPLQTAVAKQNKELVCFLLDNGADASFHAIGECPLKIAQNIRNEEILRLLEE